MNFLRHVEERLGRTVAALDLPPLAMWVLRVFVILDVDKNAAEQARQADVHNRVGVVSWKRLAEECPATVKSMAEIEQTLNTLTEWGLIQVVGQSAADPVVPGAAALRLTHAGRSCVGLAPFAQADRIRLNDKPIPWHIIHCASRETLLLEAQRLVGDDGLHPIQLTGRTFDPSGLSGLVASQICNRGCAVVDATGNLDGNIISLVRDVLWRTRRSRLPRLLQVTEPVEFRSSVMAVEGTLRWIEPVAHTRRGSVTLDKRVSDRLEITAGARETADLCGVPDSEVAMPRRVATSWTDVVVPAAVRWQLQQAVIHARFRLEVLPGRETFVGRGKGYRLLLTGLPGVGKSMCAEAMATTLGRPLVKLDLSSVLSKWLGETEKLLGQVFDVAEASGAVLVLDEAEALLRQRDSGSTGNNALATGVAYLLTRLDRFGGVLVATTNRTRELDEAFFRRFDDFIVMPIPDEPTRFTLWSGMLKCGLTGSLAGVDINLLARKFPISGGLIRGASIRANAWAEGLGRPLTTPMILASLARELEKSDRNTSEAMLEPFRAEVESLLKGTPMPPR